MNMPERARELRNAAEHRHCWFLANFLVCVEVY